MALMLSVCMSDLFALEAKVCHFELYLITVYVLEVDLKASEHLEISYSMLNTGFLFKKREGEITGLQTIFNEGHLVYISVLRATDSPPFRPAAVAAEELSFSGPVEEPEPVCADRGRRLLEERRLSS